MSLLEVHDLAFIPDDQTIVEHIEFSVDQGQHTSINGPSGSGKSTILKLIAGLIEPSQGTVQFKDQDQTSYEYTDYRQQVSYVHQSPQLFGETIRDNLSFPSIIRDDNFDEEQAQAFMERVGLDYLNLDKDINSLSGGERQRIALIRHFFYPPKILLLDEITSGLDHSTREGLWRYLFDFVKKNDITMLWISHNEDEQNLFKQQIYLSEHGTIEDIKHNTEEVTTHA
ncbi:ATP-binding cassette domain-containing protein [Aerococcaceae bacterium DSM 111020]|nr:ATP-binding cassette domain-containing protein [Aerococcaceae bacterium DSM 111020]